MRGIVRRSFDAVFFAVGVCGFVVAAFEARRVLGDRRRSALLGDRDDPAPARLVSDEPDEPFDWSALFIPPAEDEPSPWPTMPPYMTRIVTEMLADPDKVFVIHPIRVRSRPTTDEILTAADLAGIDVIIIGPEGG